MAPNYNYISEIAMSKMSWNLKVRVVRLWHIPNRKKSENSNSIELIIQDEKGDQIHATIGRAVMRIFNIKKYMKWDYYLQQRAILALTLDMVESINDYMVSLNHNSEKTYLSSDTICMSDHAFTALDHVGVPVMLVRNIDQSSGLCNGTRLIITRLGNRVIEAKVLSGNMVGEKIFIPRMTLTPSDARIPFKFQRR
ncbi:PREDICTED: uncharacterized protein LOC109217173 [Nicotiana attenuata]|uniref:uncharacterized protein LOC109217173 n=1 Tax=Nicotiana attenuata TaxID=49451 RepID=UPI000904DA73|nr:PREDICTED: uncharacterized protein LOC109217173 [Nicotiana attenuata]